MWRVPVTDVKCWQCVFHDRLFTESVYWVRSAGADYESTHPMQPTDRWRGEVWSVMERVSTTLTSFLVFFSGQFSSKTIFLVDIFLRLKEDNHSKWHCLKNWDQPNCQLFYLKRWYSTQIHVGPQRPRRWQTVSEVHNSLMKHDVSVAVRSMVPLPQMAQTTLKNFDGNSA